MELRTLLRLFVAAELIGAVIVARLLIAGPAGQATVPETRALPPAGGDFGQGQAAGALGGGVGSISSPTLAATSPAPTARGVSTPTLRIDLPTAIPTALAQDSLTLPGLTTTTPRSRSEGSPASPSPPAGPAVTDSTGTDAVAPARPAPSSASNSLGAEQALSPATLPPASAGPVRQLRTSTATSTPTLRTASTASPAPSQSPRPPVSATLQR